MFTLSQLLSGLRGPVFSHNAGHSTTIRTDMRSLANRITQETVLPISLIIVIVVCSVHATVMWVKVMNRLNRLTNNQVTIGDIQHYSTQAERLNTNFKSPDIINIIKERRSYYEVHEN